MTILVCPLSQVTDMISVRMPERIVSLLDPEFAFPEAGSAYQGRHLRLRFHDVHLSSQGQVAPTGQDVAELLDFLSAWERSAPILIHCRAGISRSTATAFITACLHNPGVDEWEIAVALRRASPFARPNGRLIELADAALGRNGRMSKAMTETGRGLPWIEIYQNVAFEMSSSFAFDAR